MFSISDGEGTCDWTPFSWQRQNALEIRLNSCPIIHSSLVEDSFVGPFPKVGTDGRTVNDWCGGLMGHHAEYFNSPHCSHGPFNTTGFSKCIVAITNYYIMTTYSSLQPKGQISTKPQSTRIPPRASQRRDKPQLSCSLCRKRK